MPLAHESWFDRLARSPTLHDRARLYSEWATQYDVDMLTVGYMNPSVTSALAGRHILPADPILDVGAGTGLLGEVLTSIGYTDLVALDMSEGMLAEAARRNVYRMLHRATLGEALDFPDATFGAVVAMGVFALGNAPPEAMDELVRVTRPGGALIFTVNATPWEGRGYKARADLLESTGRWTRIDASAPYRPIPYAPSHQHFARAFVYRRNA